MTGLSFRLGSRLLVALACAANLIAAEPPAIHVHNFAKVNDRIYRGGEPSLVGLQELGAMGIKIDVDLREPGEAADFERKQAEKLGMKYVAVPMNGFLAPTNAQIEKVLSLLIQDKSDPIFVHCRRGKDRTGTVIACYRIQHDGWGNAAALEEAKKFGMSFAERGMRSYILHFKPLSFSDISRLSPAAADRGQGASRSALTRLHSTIYWNSPMSSS
jgi:tyrosine-protein phosphatase SIW14